MAGSTFTLGRGGGGAARCVAGAGAWAGATWLQDVAGLDFVLTALFIVLAMDAYRTRPDKTIALAALGAGGTAAVLAGDAMLLVAMGAFLIFCLARHALKQRIFNKNNDKKA